MKLPRVAIVSDLREERWHSMDLVAEMLLLNLKAPDLRVVDPTELRPAMVRRFSRLPFAPYGIAETADRITNRVWDYPRWLESRRDEFDIFHVVDHSYANLVHVLPPKRTIVTCHDLDAFQGVLPGSRGGTMVSRALAHRLLDGLQAAARVVCVSQAGREQLLSYDVVDASRVTVIPNGVHPTCTHRPDPRADRELEELLGPPGPKTIELLHVGSTIARKRIDVLLESVARLKRAWPHLRLIRVGDTFTSAQERQINQLGLRDSVTVLPFVDRRVLAAVYRRATLLLQPSEREGFGLPVAESMASGTPVVASRIPALVEVGGPASTYCPVGDVRAWAAAVSELLEERVASSENWQQRSAASLAQARRFSWREHARRMTVLYRDLLPHIRAVPLRLAASQ
ncbi:MAG TPA: glycosyltransferase family 1 protein [Vicinamibacterales bacterium]